MNESPQRRNEELRARHRRILGWSLAGSLLLHAAIVLVLLPRAGTPVSPFSAAGPRAGDDRAAPAGGMQALNLRATTPPAPEPLPRPPEPIPVPDATIEYEEAPEPETPPIDFSALAGRVAGDAGPQQGPGREAGEGRGAGGTADDGRFRVVPPTPRGLILPPSDRPGEVRGKDVEVWVFVTADGRVVPDSTRLIPPTGHRDFDERLRRQAAEWTFRPARRDGRAVAEWFRYIISL